MLGPLMRRQRAFTIVELIVVVAVLAIIVTLAAPSFRDFILLQRLKSINAQVVTDMQFARSEAIARSTLMRVRFRSNNSMSCYSIYTAPTNSVSCSCLGLCGTGAVEVRTARIPRDLSVAVIIPADEVDAFAFDPVTGGIQSIPLDSPTLPIDRVVIDSTIDTARTLRTALTGAGRPSVCKPTGSTMSAEACPP